jgi:DNA mismatch repair protein MutL
VRVAGGRILGVEDCARQAGTTVVVQNLFVNVPARMKFLRSAAVETRAIADVVVTAALANLSAVFRLESNGRTLLDLPAAANVTARVAALWGDDTASRFLFMDGAGVGLTVAGLVERPDAALAGPRRVHLFVNNRPFRDRELVYAAERAYRTTVPYGARPSLLLYLHAPAGEVDVNVHPAKAEVRFRDRFAVERTIEEAIRRALGRVESAATLDQRPPLPQIRTAAPPPAGDAPPARDQLAFFVPAREPLAEPIGQAEEGPPPAAGQEAGVVRPASPAHGPGLWQIHDTYILAETRSGLLIIDQHSAHERILFQEMMQGFGNGGGASQRLLFPLTFRLSPAEYSVVADLRALFEQVGFEIEPFGGRAVIVHASPVPHPYFDAERCLREMIAELSTGSELTRAARNQHERIAMTFACKAAVKAGQRLSARELAELFDRLFATDLPYHDVHGRPTIVRLSLDELQRRFGRHG